VPAVHVRLTAMSPKGCTSALPLLTPEATVPQFAFTLNINRSVDDGSATVENACLGAQRGEPIAVEGGPFDDEPGQGALSRAVVRLVEERSVGAAAARHRRFLERCVEELGAKPETPETGDRAHINVNPPSGVHGARLCALTLTSSRLAFHGMAPKLATEWPKAELVSDNGEPTYVHIFLRGDEQVDQAMSMMKAVLEAR
jgi:hypothetical protein